MAATTQQPDVKEADNASTLVSVTRRDTFDTTSLPGAEEKIVSLREADDGNEKEVARPLDDTDKQALSSREDDAQKEVVVSPQSGDSDKNFVPQAPPMSMEKEVAAPMSGQLQSVEPGSASGKGEGTESDKFPLLHRTSTTGSGRTLYAGFRLEKKHALGLLWYQNQTIACRMVDLDSGQIGPAGFVTSSMSWTDVMLVLPPLFELHVPGIGQTMVSRFIPAGLQGIVSMKGEIECLQAGGGGSVEKWSLKRKGMVVGGRQYDMTRTEGQDGVGAEFVWKGSTRVVKEVYSATGSKQSVKHGSLKLVTQGGSGDVLAVWNQWRDSEVLGDLMVFDGVVGKLSVEVVVTSAIAVIHAERATGMNWFGGIGK